MSPPEDSFCCETLETLETNDPDVAEYLKTLQSKENNNIIKIKKEINDLEDHSVAKMKPLHKNNGNTEYRNNSPLQFPTHGSKKAQKTEKTEINADDALQEVSEALHSVKELCKSADKCDDFAYNFCITTYSQLKTISKKNKKLLAVGLILLCWNLNLIPSKIYYSLCLLTKKFSFKIEVVYYIKTEKLKCNL